VVPTTQSDPKIADWMPARAGRADGMLEIRSQFSRDRPSRNVWMSSVISVAIAIPSDAYRNTLNAMSRARLLGATPIERSIGRAAVTAVIRRPLGICARCGC